MHEIIGKVKIDGVYYEVVDIEHIYTEKKIVPIKCNKTFKVIGKKVVEPILFRKDFYLKKEGDILPYYYFCYFNENKEMYYTSDIKVSMKRLLNLCIESDKIEKIIKRGLN